MRNFIITVDGKQYQVGVEEVGVSAPQTAAPKPQAVPVSKDVPAAELSGTKVLAPFAGTVKNLLVENGASVKKDQPILVLEAMKMDNDIQAPCDGKVTFSVQKGTEVDTDTVLAVVG